MSIKKKPSGKYLIDLHLKSGGRLRMVGYTDRRASVKLEENIIALDSCLVAGERPDRNLAEWLESLPEAMKEKLISNNLLTQFSIEKSKLLKVHLQEYLKYQQGQATKGVLGIDRIQKFNKRISKIIADCGFKYLSDIDSKSIDNWITKKYSSKEYAAKTLNHCLQEFKQFCRWLVDNKRMADNALSSLKPITIDSGNTTFERRALTQDEIERLINTTKSAKYRNNLTGEQRSLVYQLALLTGLRYSEIKSLQRDSFDFINNTVTIKDIHAKNSKTDTLPLKTELSEQIHAYFYNNPALPKVKAFNNMQAKGIYMLRKDLLEANIEYITEEGQADFHSLRHTYGTQLAKSGVLPQLAQKLMRHSTIDLTTNLYTHLLISDKHEAIQHLPSIKILKINEAATGTDDTAPELNLQSDQNLPKSAYFGNNHMDKAGHFRKFDGNKNNGANTHKHSANPANTEILPLINTIEDVATNWRRDGDSNPG